MYSVTEALPDIFEAVLEAAQQAAASRPTGDMEHWQLHQNIIKEQFGTLLSGFVLDSTTQVCSQHNLSKLRRHAQPCSSAIRNALKSVRRWLGPMSCRSKVHMLSVLPSCKQQR